MKIKIEVRGTNRDILEISSHKMRILSTFFLHSSLLLSSSSWTSGRGCHQSVIEFHISPSHQNSELCTINLHVLYINTNKLACSGIRRKTYLQLHHYLLLLFITLCLTTSTIHHTGTHCTVCLRMNGCVAVWLCALRMYECTASDKKWIFLA